MQLLAELKRRNVIRIAGLYLVGAWLIVQVAETLLPIFDTPGWVLKALVVLLSIGFVPGLAFAWVFELTPEGLKREKDVDRSASIVDQTARKLDIAVIVLLLAVGMMVLWQRMNPAQADLPTTVSTTTDDGQRTASDATDQEAAPGAPIPGENAIAVLPFVDMSQAKDQEYFSDGLSEEVLNLLAQLPQIKVIARTSSFSFKGKDVDVATIAETLGVAYVLEGSVRKSGNTLRVTAQLIRASDSTHLWSQTFDRELTDVFAVQDEIAGAVVDALKIKLLPDQRLVVPGRTDNAEAYNLYLLGRQFYDRSDPASWQRAVDAFRGAIALDPDYAAAYAGLSVAIGRLSDTEGNPDGPGPILEPAETAIRLAPDLANGYVARGEVRLTFRLDVPGGRADLEKALALNPSDSVVQLTYGRLMIVTGRLPEAIAAARKATELDPLAATGWGELGRYQIADGHYPAARDALQRALLLSEDSAYFRFHMGNAWLLDRQPQEALASYEQSANAYRLVGIAMAQHSLGNDAASQQALDEAIAKRAHSAAYQIAEGFAWRGEPDKAFAWLERAYAQHDGGLVYLPTDPLIASLRDDPRYDALLRKQGLMP